MTGESASDVKRAQVEGYLREIADLQRIMDEYEDEIIRCRTALDLSGIRYRDMPGDPNLDTEKVPRLVASLLEAQEEYKEVVSSFQTRYRNAWTICHKPGEPERTMLWDYHVNRMTWEDVGRKHGYTDKAVNRAALRGIDGIWHDMPESEKRIPRAYGE